MFFAGLLIIYLARSPRPSTPPGPVASQLEDSLGKVTASTGALVPHWMKAGGQPTIGTHILHNILHSFDGASLPIVKHAAQMGYDYVGDKPDAHAYGLGRIVNINGTAYWILWVGNGAERVESPSPGTDIVSPLTQKDLDDWNWWLSVKDDTIRPNDAKRLNNRYHKDYVNVITNWYGFALDLQRGEVIDAAVKHYLDTIKWTDFDAGFIDQLLSTGYNCVATNHVHQYSTWKEGQLEFFRRLAKMFHDRGFPVAVNAAAVSRIPASTHQLIHPDHYFNEWGGSYNNSFGVIPASMVSVEVTYPPGYPSPPDAGNRNDFDQTLAAAGIAGSGGAWFGSYGETLNEVQSDGTGFMNNAIQLLRAIPNWDNLRGATWRSWQWRLYKSSNSYADANVVYSRHGKNGKLFAVFRNTSGVVQLRPGESVTSVMRADKLFIEAADGATDLSISDGQVRLANPAYVNVGYILTTIGGR
jgi:hypothetical protein